MVLSAAFGGLAALLAALGIYGTLTFAVAERRREIGVRIASVLPHPPSRRLVLSEVGRFLAVGALIGLPAAYALARPSNRFCSAFTPRTCRVFAVGPLLMAGAWPCCADTCPAHRAARIDPLDALRND